MSNCNFKLNLPTDIPWERIGVTEDMIDPVVCDKRLPAKWQTSLAVFKYRPDDEFQMYPKYNITYLKVTATIVGYQPLDKEIQGEIDWDGVNVAAIPGFTELLNSYHPCHGAILQVIVGPEVKRTQTPLPLKDYPFFLDFEPKKRELYELATDTHEKQSRSIESLNITKSGGSTQSMEVLDIDMGGGGFGVMAEGGGTGGGFNYTAPNGQWGTKRLNADESLASRSSDVGQEKRESFSFSTQISQMHHLLDSYHLGTNRVVFFIQPRPHTLEEPSGFVKGPRPVEGIQEFFMVVAQPKDQKDFCVSLSLDTSHLTKTLNMEPDRKSVISEVASASIQLPYDISSENLINEGYKFTGKEAIMLAGLGDGSWDVDYDCWEKVKRDSKDVFAPEGFIIEDFTDLINDKDNDNGESNVFISEDRTSATINVKAVGKICFKDNWITDGTCIDCPPVSFESEGSVIRQISLNCRSIDLIIQSGEEEVLMITTRGLCCCSWRNLLDPEYVPPEIGPPELESGLEPPESEPWFGEMGTSKSAYKEYVVGFKSIPKNVSVSNYLNKFVSENKSAKISKDLANKSHDPVSGTCKEYEEKIEQHLSTQKADPKHIIRLANEMSDFIKAETIKSLNDPTVKLLKYSETDFFAKQLEYKLVQTNKGRELLSEKIKNDIPDEFIPKLEKYLNKNAKEITRKDLLSLRGEDLTRIIGIKADQVQKMKLSLMGVKFNPEKPKEEILTGKKGGQKSKK